MMILKLKVIFLCITKVNANIVIMIVYYTYFFLKIKFKFEQKYITTCFDENFYQICTFIR